MLRNRVPILLSQVFAPFRQSIRCETNIVEFHNHYDVLEVTAGCTKTEIREAWLRLSMLYHPDLNKGDEEATKRFMEVKESYSFLMDDDKREEYLDKLGFRHPDPPPDFERKWGWKSEKNKWDAKAYTYMWDEEKIRKLMSSERLREVDWNKQTPAERHQILMEEEARQKAVERELNIHDTPSFQEYSNNYFLMILSCVVLYAIVRFLQRREPENSKLRAGYAMKDIELEGGGIVSRWALIPTQLFPSSDKEREEAKVDVLTRDITDMSEDY